jgi:hypothetical protein
MEEPMDLRVSIRIGRNIPAWHSGMRWEPMPADYWLTFINEVYNLLSPAAPRRVEVDTGEWDGEEEENCTITGETNNLSNLLTSLRNLAGAYQQDSIAILLEDHYKWKLMGSDSTLRFGWEATDDERTHVRSA